MATETNNANAAQGVAATGNAEQTTRSANVKFMTVAEFKQAIGATSLNVLKSPITGKLFMSTNEGHNYKVQADIDQTKDIRVLVPDADLDQACLCNVEGGAEAIFSL